MECSGFCLSNRKRRGFKNAAIFYGQLVVLISLLSIVSVKQIMNGCSISNTEGI